MRFLRVLAVALTLASTPSFACFDPDQPDVCPSPKTAVEASHKFTVSVKKLHRVVVNDRYVQTYAVDLQNVQRAGLELTRALASTSSTEDQVRTAFQTVRKQWTGLRTRLLTRADYNSALRYHVNAVQDRYEELNRRVNLLVYILNQ